MMREVLVEQFVFCFFENVKNLDGFRFFECHQVGNQFFVGLAGREFPVVFRLVAVKLLPFFGFGEKCVLAVRNTDHRRDNLVRVTEPQPPDVIHHLRENGGAGIPFLQAAGEFEFKKDFRRIKVVAKFRVIIQSKMPGVGVFHFLFGFGLEKRLAETGKVFCHSCRAWV